MTAIDYIRLFFAVIGIVTTVSIIGGYIMYRWADIDIEIEWTVKRKGS